MHDTNVAQPHTWAPAQSSVDRRISGFADSSTSVSQGVRIQDVEKALDLWGDTVLRLALCKTGNRADAEDVLQNVFMKLCQSQRTFESDDHVKAWLLCVTLTCCADVHRDPWKQRRIHGEESQEILDRAAAAPETSNPEQEADEDSFMQFVLSALTEKQRIAVHLHYFEGYSTQEIADITEEAPSTVRSHLHRARATLKTMIGGTDA